MYYSSIWLLRTLLHNSYSWISCIINLTFVEIHHWFSKLCYFRYKTLQHFHLSSSTVRSQPGRWHIIATFPSTLITDVLQCFSDAVENIPTVCLCNARFSLAICHHLTVCASSVVMWHEYHLSTTITQPPMLIKRSFPLLNSLADCCHDLSELKTVVTFRVLCPTTNAGHNWIVVIAT